MTADILKFTLHPRRIVDKVEARSYTVVEYYFDCWRFWFAVWGVR